ncbi:DddA-like double-stranded DNA deaminase toxin [Kribbella sp. NPDC051620]|uniref:DddA-like double-stranded DNA deaminase toxin n=1 Tax=Kribbella sp. NPDC051620 TaxID=3364120 RepID=UPI0037B15E51
MPSELQRVAQGLVAALDEIPRVIGYLQRTAQKCREQAGLVGGMSGNPAAQRAAMQLDDAARHCDEAVHYLSQAPPKARDWAEQMVSGVRTAEPNNRPAGARPTTGGGSPPAPGGRRGDDSEKPEGEKASKAARPANDQSPEPPDDFDPYAREILERLPERKVSRGYSPKTRGIWHDDEGIDHDLISGRHDPEFGEAQRHAERLGLVEPPYMLSTAADVELKFAMRMRRDGIRKACIILNNRPCPGDLGCNKLLPSFLPPGSQLTVYGPNNFKRTYYGETDQQ